jgi:dipeptidyl aminopeptidase/acylaminoacyl peptidase
LSNIIKNAILRVLTKRQAEQAFLAKTFLLHVANQIRRRLARGRGGGGSADAPLLKLSDNSGQTSFGYYDITPFSENNQLLLANVLPKHSAPPKPGESISVGYFDLAGQANFRKVGSTSTWCWQQGCRLQWFPDNQNELIIYNKLVDGKYGCVVQNICSREIVREYTNPIYTLDRTGRWAVFPNFSRLNRLRPGYGYVDLPDRTEDSAAPDDDGVYLFNLDSDSSELIISLDDLASLETLDSMQGADHYVNHFCFSPSGKKFLFFHLWDSPDGSYARLLVGDRSDGSCQVLEDRGEVSHYAWKNDGELLATFNYANKRARYQLYASAPRQYSTIQDTVLVRDGHPSYSPDGSMLLTDTYADKNGEQHLLLIDHEGRVIELGRYASPIMIRLRHSGEARCDLHPRWDRQGRFVCFDSAHGGGRAIYVYDLLQMPDRA